MLKLLTEKELQEVTEEAMKKLYYDYRDFLAYFGANLDKKASYEKYITQLEACMMSKKGPISKYADPGCFPELDGWSENETISQFLNRVGRDSVRENVVSTAEAISSNITPTTTAAAQPVVPMGGSVQPNGQAAPDPSVQEAVAGLIQALNIGRGRAQEAVASSANVAPTTTAAAQPVVPMGGGSVQPNGPVTQPVNTGNMYSPNPTDKQPAPNPSIEGTPAGFIQALNIGEPQAQETSTGNTCNPNPANEQTASNPSIEGTPVNTIQGSSVSQPQAQEVKSNGVQDILNLVNMAANARGLRVSIMEPQAGLYQISVILQNGNMDPGRSFYIDTSGLITKDHIIIPMSDAYTDIYQVVPANIDCALDGCLIHHGIPMYNPPLYPGVNFTTIPDGISTDEVNKTIYARLEAKPSVKKTFDAGIAAGGIYCFTKAKSSKDFYLTMDGGNFFHFRNNGQTVANRA